MSIGLIGYTGFVGSKLATFVGATDTFNTSNLQDLQDKEFDVLYVSAPSAVKWLANKNPEADRQSVDLLTSTLRTVKADRVVHISTVDVYSGAEKRSGCDEITDPSETEPYGRHRRMLEAFLLDNFDATIMRLPALFGEGLKKNLLFDLMSRNSIRANPNSTFQWFDLLDLEAQVNISLRVGGIRNITSAPLSAAEMVQSFFPGRLADLDESVPLVAYNVMSDGGYLYSKDEMLTKLKEYLK